MGKRFACFALVLGACGGGGGTDIQSSLVFADRTDAEIVRLINAAAGADMFFAEAQINQFGSTFDADPCPAVTVDGNVATITGGCTTTDGTTIEGSAVVTNPLGWDQIEDYDFGSPTVLDAQGLSFTYSAAVPALIIDGTIRRIDSLTSWDADVTVTQFDVTIRSDLYYRCANPSNPVCTLSGSGIELVGVGGARVSGTVTIDRTTNRQVSDFRLEGADVLTVHSDGTCIAWSIEGTDRGMTCP